MTTTRARAARTLSLVLGVPMSELDDDSGPDNTVSWDSLSHINLILALESEFGVTLSDEDVTDMLSLGLVVSILDERLVEQGATTP